MPHGKQVKPLISENGTYVHAATCAQDHNSLQSFLNTLPKDAKIQSRLLLNGGDIRDAMDKQSKKFQLEKRLHQLKLVNGQKVGCGNQYEDLFQHSGCEAGSACKILVSRAEFGETVGLFKKIVIAILREPLDFLEKVIKVGRPRNNMLCLPPVLQAFVQWNRGTSALRIFQHRIRFVEYWAKIEGKLKSKDGAK